MNRRGFLHACLAAATAPYVVTTAGVLMPVRKIWTPPVLEYSIPLSADELNCERLIITIIAGAGKGQEYIADVENGVVVTPTWREPPDSNSRYVIVSEGGTPPKRRMNVRSA